MECGGLRVSGDNIPKGVLLVPKHRKMFGRSLNRQSERVTETIDFLKRKQRKTYETRQSHLLQPATDSTTMHSAVPDFQGCESKYTGIRAMRVYPKGKTESGLRDINNRILT